MCDRKKRRGRTLAVLAVFGVILAGCGGQPEPPPLVEATPAAQPAPPAQAAARPALDPRLHQPFAQAAHQEPPAESQRPPDTTLAGTSVGKLYTDVVARWDGIRFVNDEGKPLAYRATIDTDQGAIELTLRPDWAPNHVRNFIALARAGYYDGLVFERALHEETEPGAHLDLLEAGCPLGTGALGYGGIGYWLRSEFNPEVKHTPGVVGACRGFEADTAGCRFYITLSPAAFLDGNFTAFAQVSRGLDVARTIHKQPVRRDDNDPEQDHRPLKPVVLRKVVVHEDVETEPAAPARDN